VVSNETLADPGIQAAGENAAGKQQRPRKRRHAEPRQKILI